MQRAPVYDARRILSRLEAIVAGEGRWQAYFSRTGIAPVELWYEDVETDPRGAVAAIASHCEVRLDGATLDPDASFRRQRTGLNEDWRARFRAEIGDPDQFDPTGASPLRRAIAALRAGLR